MTAPIIASVGTITTTTSATINIAVPSGVTSGSLVLTWIWAYWAESSTVPASSVFTPPSGFALGDFRTFLDTTDNVYAGSAWFYKYTTGADSGTYTFSGASVGGVAPASLFGVSFLITNAPGSGSPFADQTQFASSSTTTTSVSISSFTPGGGNALLLAGYEASSGTIATLPAGWATDATNNTLGIMAVGHTTQSTATSTGTLTFSSSSSGVMFAHLVTVRIPPAGLPYLRFN